jgi:hypothetical protein
VSARRKWPIDATHEVRIRLTPGQVERWKEARSKSSARGLDTWVADAVDFFAWYICRERELLRGVTEQLEREAAERLAKEREPW